MKLKLNEYLIPSKKSVKFEKKGDTFWINKRFIQRTKKGIFANFPQWATQIYVKHNGKMYDIFLDDFEKFMTFGTPIPFQNHFPKERIEKPKPLPKKRYRVEVVEIKPITFDGPIQEFDHKISIEPTHDELVMARRNGEI